MKALLQRIEHITTLVYVYLTTKQEENIMARGSPALCELSGLPDIYTFKLLHQMKHLRTNYKGFNTTLLSTNLGIFPFRHMA